MNLWGSAWQVDNLRSADGGTQDDEPDNDQPPEHIFSCYPRRPLREKPYFLTVRVC